MAAHTDGSNKHPHDELLKSTHTFLLYLKDTADGGETALLESVHGDALASVPPRAGTMLIFPHRCPHVGRPLGESSKVVLRGELAVEPS